MVTKSKILCCKLVQKEELEQIMNSLIISMKTKKRLQEQFSVEYGNNTLSFSPLNERERCYLLVLNGGRAECLFSVNLNVNGQVEKANISSFGRIVEKDETVSEGWCYLEEIIESFFSHKGVRMVLALVVSPGGLKAFRDLQSNCEHAGKNYFVVMVPGKPGVTGLIKWK